MKKVITLLVPVVLILAALLLFRATREQEKVMASETINLTASLMDNLQMETVMIGNDKTVDAMRVRGVLDIYHVDVSTLKGLDFISNDGMNMEIGIEELPDLFLAPYEDDTFRLIIPTDEFHQRWLKNIVKIELQ